MMDKRLEDALRVNLNGKLGLEMQGSKLTNDAGLRNTIRRIEDQDLMRRTVSWPHSSLHSPGQNRGTVMELVY